MINTTADLDKKLSKIESDITKLESDIKELATLMNDLLEKVKKIPKLIFMQGRKKDG